MTKFDESRIITHPTGYNYVRVTPTEVMHWGGLCICNHCNEVFTNQDMNLCWSLTDTYCDDCFKRISDRWYNLPKEDIDFDLELQKQNSLDWYKYHLDPDFRHQVMKTNNEKRHQANKELDKMFDDIIAEIFGSEG